MGRCCGRIAFRRRTGERRPLQVKAELESKYPGEADMSDEFCIVIVTVGKAEEAEKIASALVEERLAACCSLVPRIRSIYRWKGEVHRDEETLMLIKTRRTGFEALRRRVAALHSYEVPEIVALPVVAGHQPYLDWLAQEVSG